MPRCVMEKKKHFVCIVYFYLGLDKGSIQFYQGLTLNLISQNFFEVLSPKPCTFNFCQNKNIFNQYSKFLSNLIFSLIRTFKNKMIQNQNLSQSKIINIMTNKKENVNTPLNFNFLQITSKDCNLLKSVLKCLFIANIKLVTEVFYFYKKHVFRLTSKNKGMTNLWASYISLMVKRIYVVFLLHFMVT